MQRARTTRARAPNARARKAIAYNTMHPGAMFVPMGRKWGGIRHTIRLKAQARTYGAMLAQRTHAWRGAFNANAYTARKGGWCPAQCGTWHAHGHWG